MVRPRVLLAIEPALYERAMLDLLRNVDVDDVASRSELRGDLAGSYNVAIVTGTVPPGVHADATIVLPQTASGTGILTMHDCHGCRTVTVTELRHIFDALDVLAPTARRRFDLI